MNDIICGLSDNNGLWYTFFTSECLSDTFLCKDSDFRRDGALFDGPNVFWFNYYMPHEDFYSPDHPQEIIMAQFSLHVHKCGLKPHPFFCLMTSLDEDTYILFVDSHTFLVQVIA